MALTFPVLPTQWAAQIRIAGVYLLIVMAYMTAVLFLGMSARRPDGSPATFGLFIGYVILYSALAWGCFRQKKVAYWLGAAVLAVECFFLVKALPDELKFLTKFIPEIMNSEAPLTFQNAFSAQLAFYCMALLTCLLKPVALLLLFLPSSREAFGVGRFASVKN